MKFSQIQQYNLAELNLTHNFALKMASIISWAVVSAISIMGVFAGAVTSTSLGVLAVVVAVFGIVTFFKTRKACLE